MNFKKLKRMLSIVLSATMILSTNMTGLAASVESVPEQQEWQFDTEMTDDGISRYVSEDGAVMYSAESPADESGTDSTVPNETTQEEKKVAQIGDTKYATLDEALKVAGETTINLLENAVLEGTAAYDLTGKTVNTNGNMITIANGAKIKLTAGTFINNTPATVGPSGGSSTLEGNHVMINAEPGSKLTIGGDGRYSTHAVQLLRVKGDVVIENGTFECIAMPEEIAAQHNYNGAVMFSVAESTGKLTMYNGTINAKAGAGNNDGMYGIYVYDDATVILGDKEAKTGPTVQAKCAAIGMNSSQPTASLTIHGGTYTSEIKGSAQGEEANPEAYNTVLYLSTKSTVTINDGIFTANGRNADAQIHAVSLSANTAQVVTINGGTFTSQNEVFCKMGDAVPVVKGGTFSSDPSTYLPTSGYDVEKNTTANTWTVTRPCGHNVITYVPEDAAGCFKTGTLSHYVCNSCGQKFALADGTVPLTDEDVAIEKKNHDGVFFAAVPSTCQTKGHDAYYYCENCEKAYATIEALQRNENPQDKTTYNHEEYAPHNYDIKDGKSPYTFDWGKAAEITTVETLADLKTIEDIIWTTNDDKTQTVNVTATRKCNVCGDTSNGTVTVEKTGADAFDCTKGASVKYTATAAFTEDADPSAQTTAADGEDGEPEPITNVHTVTIPAAAHDYNLTLTWATDVNLNNVDLTKLTELAAKATAKRSCKNCAKTEETAKSVTLSLPQDGDSTDIPDCIGGTVTLTVTAVFADDTTVTGTQDVTVTASGVHSWSYQKYQAPKCDEAGRNAYYECSKCGKKVWSPEPSILDAPTNQVGEGQEIIPMIDHNFSLPKFEWEQEGVLPTAKATFTCLKCDAKIVRQNLAVAKEGEHLGGGSYGCTGEVEMSYKTTAAFNKACVWMVMDEENPDEPKLDAYGDKQFVYKEGEADPDKTSQDITYTGYVTKTIVPGHKFTFEANWADKDTATGDVHDTEQGIVGVLTCSKCSGTVTVNSKTTDGTAAIGGTAGAIKTATGGKVTPVLDETSDKYVEAFCTTGGHDVYNVTMECTVDGTKYSYPAAPAEGEEAEKKVLETDVEPLGHRFQVLSESDVVWDEPDAAQSDVRVTLKCQRNPNHNVVLTGEKEGVKAIPVTASSAAEVKTESGYKPTTCTSDGKLAWGVEITYLGTKITKYNTDGVKAPDAPASKTTEGTGSGNTDDEAASTNNGTIYITREEKAPGHQYVAKGWNTEPYRNGQSNEIYYIYECNAATCDKAAKDAAEHEITVGKDNKVVFGLTEDGQHTVRKVTAKIDVDDTIPPTCETEGQGTTTISATVNGKPLPSESWTGALPPKGHTWADTVTWKDWTATGDSIKVEIKKDEQTSEEVTVPVYQVTASRACTVCKKEDNCTGTLSAADPKPNAGGNYIKVKATGHKDAACGEAGYTNYEATFYGRSNSLKESEEIKAVGAAATKNVPHDALAHSLSNTVKVDWKTLTEEILKKADGTPETTASGHEIGTGTFTVEAGRLCNKCNETIPVPVDVTVTGGCGEGGAAFKATVSEDYTPESGAKLTVENGGVYTDETYTAHRLYRVAAKEGNCGEVSYNAHWHCEQCGKDYKNSDATTEVEVSFEKQTHRFENPEFNWSVEGKSANAVFTCSRCQAKSDVYSAEVGKEAGIDIAPKCNATGTAYYPVSVVFAKEQEGFASLRYDDEMMVTVPVVDHSFTKGDADNKVCEWCGKPQSGLVKVSYVTSTGVTIQESWYDKTATEITDAPTAPNQSAYTFSHWEVNKVKLAENTTLAAAVLAEVQKAGITAVEVKAVYTKIETEANVTIGYKGITKDSEAAVKVAIGSAYEKTADTQLTDASDKTWYFSHWENETGDVLGYSAAYRIFVQSSDAITVYAVYSETEPSVTARPVISITNKYRSSVDGAYKVSFTSTMNVPDTFEIVESGVLYTTKKELATTNSMKVDNASVGKKTMSGTKTNTASFKVKDPATVVYTCGYLRFKDKETSKEEVIYTSIESGSYNTLQDLPSEAASN